MNTYIDILYRKASAPHRNIIGLMSGTSLDGLDLAYCKIKGFGTDTDVELVEFDTIPYDKKTKDKIKKVFAKKEVDFSYLVLLNEWIGILHGEMVLQFLKNKGIPKEMVDCVASHGQTVMHVPSHQHQHEGFSNATLQIGDGDHVALTTGIITISDFRQKHVAAGGEGAPLAVYGDYLLFSEIGQDRIMLNMGGISNFTYLPSLGQPQEVFVTDTGTGNTLMDQYMKMYFNQDFDNDATIARQGFVHSHLLSLLMSHYFFDLPFPKTTGPEVFNLGWLEQIINEMGEEISHENVMATLNYFSAKTLSEALLSVVGDRPFNVYVSGGGAHNPLLMTHLRTLLHSCQFYDSNLLGIPGDAKEAVLFAVLANETLAGQPIEFGDRMGVPSVCMGKISFPR